MRGADRAPGVSLSGYEVWRFNAAGRADPALNATLRLAVYPRSEGGQALSISILDASGGPVALEVRYPAGLRAQGADFSGLLGPDSAVLSASFLGQPGRAALGQALLGGRSSGPLNGHFATLRFAPGAPRQASAIGDVHHNAAGVASVKQALPNLSVSSDPVAQSCQIQFTAAWQIADGDQNSEVNIADITPIGVRFGQTVSTDWRALAADYDGNGEVNLADLTPIGLYYGEGTDSYAIEASDNTPGAALSSVETTPWSAALAPTDPGNPAGTTLPELFSRWEITIDGPGSFSFSELMALDANADGTARIWVTPLRGTQRGASASRDVAVLAGAPTAALIGNPLSGEAPLDVAFDASGSSDDQGISVYRFDYTDDGSWDQEGASSSANFQYSNPGTFTCRLEVEDPDSNTAQATVVITASTANQAPVADIQATPTSGAAPLDVAFDASGSTDDGTITVYRFDFTDDGTWDQEGASAAANFQYSSVGSYTCRLEVEDDGALTAQGTVGISVSGGGGSLTISGRCGVLFEKVPISSDPWGHANPLPGVEMRAYNIADSSTILGVATSDASGNFTVTGLPALPGDFDIMVVEPTNPSPSGQGWAPGYQKFFLPFKESVPGPTETPNSYDQFGPTVIDTNGF